MKGQSPWSGGRNWKTFTFSMPKWGRNLAHCPAFLCKV